MMACVRYLKIRMRLEKTFRRFVLGLAVTTLLVWCVKQANVQHPIMGNIKTFIFIAGEPLCIIICDLESKSTQEIKMRQGFSVLLIINIIGSMLNCCQYWPQFLFQFHEMGLWSCIYISISLKYKTFLIIYLGTLKEIWNNDKSLSCISKYSWI